MRFYHSTAIALSSIATFLLTAPPVAAQAAAVGDLFFFGDSAVSMGNFYEVTGLPFDPRYSRDGFTRRESNGPIWVERLTGGDVNASLDPNRTSANINYAFSSGTLGRLAPFGDEGGDVGPIGVLSQLDLFDGERASQRITITPSAIAFVGAGGNDVLDGISADQEPEDIASDIIANSLSVVNRLVDAGVKTIFFEQVPDVDIIPAAQVGVDAAFRMRVREFTQDIRAVQREALVAATADLPADTQLVALPLHRFATYAIENAAALGFQSVDEGCIDVVTGALCSEDVSVQNSFLFWDDIHLSASAQAEQARFFAGFVDAALGNTAQAASRLADIAASASQTGENATLLRLDTAAFAPPGLHFFADYDRTRHRFDAAKGRAQASIRTRSVGGGAEYFWPGGHVLGVSVHRISGDGQAASVTSLPFRQAGDMTFDMLLSQTSVYGRLQVGLGFIDGVFSYTDVEFGDIQRPTGTTLLTGRSDTDGRTLQGRVRAGMPIDLGGAVIKPFVAIAYSQTRLDAFAENDDDLYGLALTFDEQKRTQTDAEIGAFAQSKPISALGLSIHPWARASYSYSLDGDGRRVGYNFVDNITNPISVELADTARHTGDLAVGASVSLVGPVWLNWKYQRRFNADQRAASNLYVGITAAF